MKKRVLHYLLLCCLLFPYSTLKLRGQDISISTQLDRSAIQIGEYATIKMKIRTNDLENTLLAIPQKEDLHQAEMISFQVLDTISLDGGAYQLNAEMIITSFDEAVIELPAFGVMVGGQQYHAAPLFLKVTMPEVDTLQPEKYYDIKEPLPVKLHWWEYLLLILLHPITWIVLGVQLIAAIGYGIYHYRKHRPTPPEPAPIPLTPLQVFDREIERLHSLPFTTQEEQIYYYDRLIALLRTYLCNGIGLDTEEMTARDIWLRLQQPPYQVARTPLYTWVQHSEWVRFADSHAESAWQSDDIDIVVQLAHLLDKVSLKGEGTKTEPTL